MTTTAPAQNTAGKTVRRLVVFILLFSLVATAAVGLAGLLERLLEVPVTVAGDVGTFGLASSLAFTLIAGPLAGLIWWFAWRGAADPAERNATLWGFYVAAMATTALVLGVCFLLWSLTGLLEGEWDEGAFALGLVWLAVWFWHRWMSRHLAKSPTRLAGGSRILGYTFGIIIGAIHSVALISTLVERATSPALTLSTPSWTPILQSALWVVAGVTVWWLHWKHDGGSTLRTGFATVMLVLITGLAAVTLTLGGLASTLYVLLRLLFDRSEGLESVLDPLGLAVGSAAVGAVLWAYYRVQLREASAAARRGTQLVSAGVALAAAASGIGIIANSLLAAVSSPLVGSTALSLLLTGLAALVVAGPAWWLIWRPAAPVTEEHLRDTGRRVYLVTVFGVSALVAIVTLLGIGYQLFLSLLSGENASSLLESVRSSLGLLLATGIVAGYHFSLWRRDRSLLPAETTVRTIGQVVLVASAVTDEAVSAIRAATGASVTIWTSVDDTTAADPADYVAALAGVTAPRVLVTLGPDGLRIIPLAN